MTVSENSAKGVNIIDKICSYMVRYGTENTLSGSYYIEPNHLAKVFNINEKYIIENVEDIVDSLLSREEIIEADYFENSFSLMFFYLYCGIEEDE